MNILLISYEYPPETGFGGIGTYTWYQARALAKLGHDVSVLAGATAPTPLKSEVRDGVTVYRFRAGGPLMFAFKFFGLLRLWWTRNRLENALSMFRGFKELRRTRAFDVIEVPECGADGLLINLLSAETVLARFHGPARIIMPYYDVPETDMSLCSMIEHISMSGADHLIACSSFMAGQARGMLGRKRPVRVIHNGIDLELFDSTAKEVDIRRKYDIPGSGPVILFGARMEVRKGIHLCKEIAAAVLERHEAAFVFAGQDLFEYMSGELLPYLKARRLRGTFHYLGMLDQKEIRSCVLQSDIVLIPSLWENCPYSCLEAMAAGRAIVSSDQGGMPELIRDGQNGLLAEAGVSGPFISAIERLILDPRLRQRLGRAARKTVEESFTDLHMARSTAQYYRECLGR
jgi:glycosyltransferase involved in cell wall biosynthesis